MLRDLGVPATLPGPWCVLTLIVILILFIQGTVSSTSSFFPTASDAQDLPKAACKAFSLSAPLKLTTFDF